MGICEGCCDRNKENNRPQTDYKPSSGGKYDPKTIERNFNDYIFSDNIIDFLLQKYNLNDPVFKLVKNEENKMLTNFYKSKKDDFKTQMTSYLNGQNLNFVNLLTSQIISNENGTKIMKQKIRNQIEIIENDENNESFKISYLTVLILGQSGTGKSCLVNNILFDGKEVAKENAVDIGTTAMITPYKNPKKVPYLRLIDTRGIELADAWNVNAIGEGATTFIRDQLKKQNFNDFVHCIWYCVKSQRFTQIERKLIDDIIKTVTNDNETQPIPVIIVLTKAMEPGAIKQMKAYIKKKNFNDVVDIIAKRIETYGGNIERRGLDELVNLTVKKCKENFNGDLKKVMMKNLTKHVKEKLFAGNSNIKSRIIRLMKIDTVEKDLANKSFDKYVNDIYNYNVCNFLELSQMSRESSNLIKNAEFNRHKTNFFSFCSKYIEKIISNELPFFANKFLDIQATKEIEKNHPLQMSNKRNYEGFIKSSGKFLFDNFNYNASKFYIFFVITKICPHLSDNFEAELNKILNKEMTSNDIQENIAHCYYRKFDDFDKYKNKFPPFSLSIYNSYDIPNFNNVNIDNNNMFDFNFNDTEQ